MGTRHEVSSDIGHGWYERTAAQFEHAAAIEKEFLELTREDQERLNRFKLWALEHGGHVSLDDKDILESGAGHGRLALSVPNWRSYTGVDYASNLVALGNRRLRDAGLADRAQLVHGDALTYEAGRLFDVVCSLGMLPSFRDPRPALKRMSEHLRPGGALFADFRCTSWLYSEIRRVKWRFAPPTAGTDNLCRPGDIARTLRDLGFVRVHVVAREFPGLAGWYAKHAWDWPLFVRNAMSQRRFLQSFATEAWVFATKCRRRPD